MIVTHNREKEIKDKEQNMTLQDITFNLEKKLSALDDNMMIEENKEDFDLEAENTKNVNPILS